MRSIHDQLAYPPRVDCDAAGQAVVKDNKMPELKNAPLFSVAATVLRKCRLNVTVMIRTSPNRDDDGRITRKKFIDFGHCGAVVVHA